MARSEFFLRLPTDSAEALNCYDPLRNDPLVRLFDPLPRHRALQHGEASFPLVRILVVWLLICLPSVALSLIPSISFGGDFSGPGGMTHDLAIWVQYALFAAWMVLLAVVRRAFGLLIRYLREHGIALIWVTGSLDPTRLPGRSWITSFLEWPTRLSPRRTLFWLAVLLPLNAVNGIPSALQTTTPWWASPPTPGTLLYPLHKMNLQPNLAGIWHFCGLSVLGGYLILLIIRMFVVFLCLTVAIARDPALHIVPTHPDRTGGLLPVGQTALLLSGFTFSAGVWLAAFVLQSIATSHEFPLGFMSLILWAIYLLLGPLLFFLPLVPLRPPMRDAKRNYLQLADHLYTQTSEKHDAQLHGRVFEPGDLQGMVALQQLIGVTEDMAVWPFDRATFKRFGGVLIAPIASLVLERLSPFAGKLLELLHLGR